MSSKTGALHTFFCAQCGEAAATLSMITSPPTTGGAAEEVAAAEVGWPDLRTPHFRLDWLGSTVGPASDAVETALGAESVDPRALAKIDGDLGAFCCRHCEQNYCASCWRHWPVFDDDGSGWFEETRGRCPEGHEQRLMD